MPSESIYRDHRDGNKRSGLVRARYTSTAVSFQHCWYIYGSRFDLNADVQGIVIEPKNVTPQHGGRWFTAKRCGVTLGRRKVFAEAVCLLLDKSEKAAFLGTKGKR